MKKNLIALMMSIVMVIGSTSAAPVYAAAKAVQAGETVFAEEGGETQEAAFEETGKEAGSNTEAVSDQDDSGEDILDQEAESGGESAELQEETDQAENDENTTTAGDEDEDLVEAGETVIDGVSAIEYPEKSPTEEFEDETAQDVKRAAEEPSAQEEEELIEITEPDQLEEDQEAALAGSTTKNVAQAIWTEDNTTFYFYYGPQVSVGMSFKGNRVSRVWSGTDVTDTGNSTPKWIPDVPPEELLEDVFSYPVMCYATRVVFDNSFKSVKPKSMYGWFEYCGSMTSLDIRGLDTSEVKTMNSMFMSCGLANIKLTVLDTSRVTDMRYMFSGCSRLKSVNLSGLDTSNVTDMSGMFSECGSLMSVNVSGFNTSNVTDMSNMFRFCDDLTSLDVSGFDTSNVTDMSGMFKACKSLTNVDVSGYDTSGVTSMSGMFMACKSLTDVDVSGFDTSNVTDISGMFRECESLTNVDVSGFDTSNVTNMNSMFYECESLTNEDVSGFDTSNVTDLGFMFKGCESLTIVDVGGFDTSNLTDMCNMFAGCKCLRAILCSDNTTEWKELDGWYGEDVFSGCFALNGLDGNVKVSYNMDKTDSSMAKAAGLGGYFTPKASAYLQLGKTSRGDMFNLANNVKVTWKAVPAAKYYKVYRSGLKDPVIVTSGLVGWDKEPGLVNGQKYTYTIVASMTGKGDSSGDSLLSYSKVMYRLKTVVIRSVKNTAPGKVTVKYDKTTSGDSYVLQYCERQDMVGAKTKVVLGANNTSYVIGGLKKGKTYYISIRVRKKVNGIDYYTTFGVPKKITITK